MDPKARMFESGEDLPFPLSSSGVQVNYESYRILQKLGRGSFSTVWLADVLYDQAQRDVALKVCAVNVDPRNELDIVSQLSSHNELDTPNVLQLHGSFLYRDRTACTRFSFTTCSGAAVL